MCEPRIGSGGGGGNNGGIGDIPPPTDDQLRCLEEHGIARQMELDRACRNVDFDDVSLLASRSACEFRKILSLSAWPLVLVG